VRAGVPRGAALGAAAALLLWAAPGAADEGVGAGAAVGYGSPGHGDLPAVHLGAPKISGGYAPALVNRILRARASAFRYCYEKALAAWPELAGRLTIQFTIGADGKVSGARVADSDLKDPAVGACVVAAAGRLDFPAPAAGPVEVSVPLTFELPRPAAVVLPPDAPRYWVSCTRSDAWRATIALSLDLPEGPAARKAFVAACGARLEAIRRCYEKSLAAPPVPPAGDSSRGPEEAVGLALSLSPAGKVVTLALDSPAAPSAASACAIKGLSGLVLPLGKGDERDRSASVVLTPPDPVVPMAMGHGK
jgi:TonB family protein